MLVTSNNTINQAAKKAGRRGRILVEKFDFDRSCVRSSYLFCTYLQFLASRNDLSANLKKIDNALKLTKEFCLKFQFKKEILDFDRKNKNINANEFVLWFNQKFDEIQNLLKGWKNLNLVHKPGENGYKLFDFFSEDNLSSKIFEKNAIENVNKFMMLLQSNCFQNELIPKEIKEQSETIKEICSKLNFSIKFYNLDELTNTRSRKISYMIKFSSNEIKNLYHNIKYDGSLTKNIDLLFKLSEQENFVGFEAKLLISYFCIKDHNLIIAKKYLKNIEEKHIELIKGSTFAQYAFIRNMALIHYDNPKMKNFEKAIENCNLIIDNNDGNYSNEDIIRSKIQLGYIIWFGLKKKWGIKFTLKEAKKLLYQSKKDISSTNTEVLNVILVDLIVYEFEDNCHENVIQLYNEIQKLNKFKVEGQLGYFIDGISYWVKAREKKDKKSKRYNYSMAKDNFKQANRIFPHYVHDSYLKTLNKESGLLK